MVIKEEMLSSRRPDSSTKSLALIVTSPPLPSLRVPAEITEPLDN